MAVDDPTAFHKLNLHDDKIKKDYTVFARFTHGRAIQMTQKYGAKIHFNEIKLPQEFNQYVVPR